MPPGAKTPSGRSAAMPVKSAASALPKNTQTLGKPLPVPRLRFCQRPRPLPGLNCCRLRSYDFCCTGCVCCVFDCCCSCQRPRPLHGFHCCRLRFPRVTLECKKYQVRRDRRSVLHRRGLIALHSHTFTTVLGILVHGVGFCSDSDCLKTAYDRCAAPA